MHLTIRERSQNVFKAAQEQGIKGIEKIAAATGLSKSSVHRHQQGIKRRNQYPESAFWDSAAGSAWLKRLVCGCMFFFGIKHSIGVGELSSFLQALHLELHVGCSPSALASLKTEMKQTIAAYGETQAEFCQPQAGQGICVGGDEVFFGLPVLVMVELASGYILTETLAEDRSYDTWKEAIASWWNQGGWHCRWMVSDRAKALIKLASDGLGCVSVPDLFHALHALGQPIRGALARQRARLNQLKATLAKPTQPDKLCEREQALAPLSSQQATMAQHQATYDEAMITLSQTLHPFDGDTSQFQSLSDIEQRLSQPLAQLESIAQEYGGAKALKAIASFTQQIPDIALGIHAWWHWVLDALSAQPPSLEVQNWVIQRLLPWVYWLQQADKTHHPELKARYQQAAEKAATHLLADPLTQALAAQERDQWIDWARWMTNNYQRTSSAVEGRNGYLTRLHHSGRGFSEQDLTVLTILHNFHLTRPDGTTAAQRLFGHEFPDVFEWAVEHMRDLPLARRSRKSQRPNPFHLEGFPA